MPPTLDVHLPRASREQRRPEERPQRTGGVRATAPSLHRGQGPPHSWAPSSHLGGQVSNSPAGKSVLADPYAGIKRSHE